MQGRQLLLAGALLALVLAGCLGGDGGADESRGWAFTDTEGRTHTADDARGSPTVLFFMATWCPSCRGQTDAMRRMAANYTPRGVDVYSLSWDPDEGDDDLRDWKREHDQPWPHGTDPGLEVARRYDVKSQSTVLVLDANNSVTRRWNYGDHASPGEMAAVLDDLLAS